MKYSDPFSEFSSLYHVSIFASATRWTIYRSFQAFKCEWIQHQTGLFSTFCFIAHNCSKGLLDLDLNPVGFQIFHGFGLDLKKFFITGFGLDLEIIIFWTSLQLSVLYPNCRFCLVHYISVFASVEFFTSNEIVHRACIWRIDILMELMVYCFIWLSQQAEAS